MRHIAPRGSARTLLAFALVVLAAWSGSGAHAQSVPVTSYTTDDGLSYAQVWSLHQDRRGYLWIGTTDGLSRWDGLSFVTFSTDDGFKDTTIRAIVEDDDGRLWFGTEKGVAVDDGRSIHHYDDVPSLDDLVWSATKDTFGRIWFGTHLNGATVYDKGKFRAFGPDEGLASRYIYSLFSDSKGYLWFGHRGEGLTRCKAHVEKGIDECRHFGLDDGLPNLDIRAFVEDAHGYVYIGTRGGGIARWDGTAFRTFGTKDGLGEDDIYAMHLVGENGIAVGTLNRGVDLCRLPNFESCRSFTVDNGMPDDATLSLLEDHDQAIWVGYQSGLARITVGNMLSFTLRDGLPHSTAYAVLGDPNGSVWLGTLGGLVEIRIDDETTTATRLNIIRSNDGLPGDQIWDLLRDSQGRMWIATEGGLCQFDTSTRRCNLKIDMSTGLESNDLITLRESSRGEILASSNEGLSIITVSGRKVSIRNVTVDDGLAGSIVYGVGEDRDGRIWVGSDQGLSSIDGKVVRPYTTDDGLPSNEIHAIYTDEDGTMWLGTIGGGVVEFTPPAPGSSEKPRFKAYGQEVGVYPSAAAIEPDRHGRLWLGTQRGAILFDPARARRGERAIVTVVDRTSGLVANEVNAFDYDTEGNLWIAAAGGATRYDEAIAKRLVPSPAVSIESVITPDSLWLAPFGKPETERSNRYWLDGSPIELAPRSATIRISYRSDSFRDPQRVRYQVRLAGFRDDWSDDTNASFKEYTNLFPGRYAFEVRASVRAGEWGEPARLEMTLQPALWQRPSFIVTCVAGFLLLLALGYRARTYAINRRNLELARAVDERTEDLRRYAKALEEHSHALDRANFRIREADRVKSEFLANMSHELRTPLNSIIGFSDVLVPSLERQIDDRQHRFLRNIQMSGRYLLLLINNLLDLSKIEAGRADVVAEPARIDEIVSTTCEIVRGYAADRAIEVIATVPENMPEVLIDIPKFRQILLNLLSNAVKFSRPGSAVEVEVRQVPKEHSSLRIESFELVVLDHGPGISARDREAIFEEFKQVGGGTAHPGGTGLGLALVRRFVNLLKGEISVDSSPGQGSTFRVMLPVRFEADSSGVPGEKTHDSEQPRVIVLTPEDELFAEFALTMEHEGFAPVRARSIEDATRLSRRVDPVAIVVSIDVSDRERWDVVESIGSDPALSGLMIGICLTAGGQVVIAAGADSLLLQPVVGDTRARIASFSAPEGSDPVFFTDSDDRIATIAKAVNGDSWPERRASSPSQTVAMTRELEPGVVIVDLAAKGLAGFEAARRIQVEKQTRHTPVVLVAPGTIDADAWQRLTARHIDEITSPLDELGPTLHELLRRRSGRAVRLAAANLA